MASQRDQLQDALLRDLEAADPENRLVTSELEARWNKALARVGEIEAKIAKHRTVTPQPLPMSASQATALAGNLRTVWTAPTTDARLKKRIVRTLIKEVVADLDDGTSEIVLVIHWVGGVHTELRLPKRRCGRRDATPGDIVDAVRQLVLIANDDVIAGVLDRNGLTTGNGNRSSMPAAAVESSPCRRPSCCLDAGGRLVAIRQFAVSREVPINRDW